MQAENVHACPRSAGCLVYILIQVQLALWSDIFWESFGMAGPLETLPNLTLTCDLRHYTHVNHDNIQ